MRKLTEQAEVHVSRLFPRPLAYSTLSGRLNSSWWAIIGGVKVQPDLWPFCWPLPPCCLEPIAINSPCLMFAACPMQNHLFTACLHLRRKENFCPLFMEYSNSWRKLQLTYWDFNCGALFSWQSFFKGGNKRPVRRPSAPPPKLIINAETELPAIDWAEMNDSAPKGVHLNFDRRDSEVTALFWSCLSSDVLKVIPSADAGRWVHCKIKAVGGWRSYVGSLTQCTDFNNDFSYSSWV